MTLSYLRNYLVVCHLLVAVVRAQLNITGEAVTTRFWDCCKPSCSWKNKAEVSHPVQDCNATDIVSPNTDVGSGCGEGGAAYTCNSQVPWAVNDTFSYGFAGVFISGGEIEKSWCCACYQLEFTSDPVKGKTMIVQASNSALDVISTNRFSLAIPGGNTTSHDGCARQYGVDQKVFGETNSGVGSLEDCDKLPEALRDSCRWRFGWFQDAQYPSANFKRVVCPSELTEKSNCVRNDEPSLAEGKTSVSTLMEASPLLATFAMILAGLLSAL